jgi:hypothetical protein
MRVLKPITTPLHFYPAGATVTAEDLDGPLTVEDWQRLGHLEAPAQPKQAKASAAPAVAPTDSALSD